MLIPRFSLRWLLGLTTAFALLSLVWSFAFRGAPWALGISAAINGLALVFAFHAGAFLVAWLLSQAFSAAASSRAVVARQAVPAESPFAAPAPAESPFAVAPPVATPPQGKDA
jgi:hypothetical protein